MGLFTRWKKRMKIMMTSTCCQTLDCITQEQNSKKFLVGSWLTKLHRLPWIICMVYPAGREMDSTAPPDFMNNTVTPHCSAWLKGFEQHCFNWDHLSAPATPPPCIFFDFWSFQLHVKISSIFAMCTLAGDGEISPLPSRQKSSFAEKGEWTSLQI